jgi:hypothetical protein
MATDRVASTALATGVTEDRMATWKVMAELRVE